jgi:hypothetical protein
MTRARARAGRRYTRAMVRWSGRTALGLALLALAGCALASPAARSDAPPRVRCLSKPDPGSPDWGPRPLVYLFCIQSP